MASRIASEPCRTAPHWHSTFPSARCYPDRAGRLRLAFVSWPDDVDGAGIPELVRSRVDPAPRGVGGGTSVVDATAWDASTGSFAVTAGPSMRMVVDLGDLDSSRWVNLTGTSGQPASPHYSDQLAAWAAGRTFAWPFTPAATHAGDRLTLRPAA